MLKKSDVAIMAIATGLIVANLYYCQPLILLIAQEFGVTEIVAGRTIYLTQAGYALGLFCLVPLGDKFERKKQIIITTSLTTVFLAIAALSSNFMILQLACFAIGFTSIVPQLILPMAANLAAPEQRGKVVGIVMSGLLVGILLSRTLSGFVGEIYGWRTMYWIASAISVILLVILYIRFPKNEASFKGTYKELMTSLFSLIGKQPVLREASLINLTVFAVFGCFWASMVLFLSSDTYSFKADEIGLFGIVGATGALLAPIVGKMSDKSDPRIVVDYGLIILLASQVLFFFLGVKLMPFILGIIVLEIGQQSVHVSNQTRVYALDALARNRLNTVFMTASFIGTAAGSAFGLFLWELNGWSAVCLGSGGLVIVSLLIYFVTNKKKNIEELS